MTSRWIAACLTSCLTWSALAARPAFAQSPAPRDAPPPPPAAPASPQAPGDPNVSYPLANGGTYQGPLTGQPDPTVRFYEGYNRT